jgi:sugar lactone lactonase YvrE
VGPDGRILTSWPVLPSERASRLNDGSCDPAGRFLVGSLSLGERRGDETLVRLEPSGQLMVLDEDLGLSNGLGWSPDGRALYSVDTVPGVLWRREYDGLVGTVGPRQELIRVPDGSPDGLAVDVEGNLWVAVWGAGQVRRYRPDGELLAVVDVPAPHTSSVAFVGPRRDRLLITTARAELSTAQLADFPDSGRLFLADPGVTGVPTVAWQPVAWQPGAPPATPPTTSPTPSG